MTSVSSPRMYQSANVWKPGLIDKTRYLFLIVCCFRNGGAILPKLRYNAYYLRPTGFASLRYGTGQ